MLEPPPKIKFSMKHPLIINKGIKIFPQNYLEHWRLFLNTRNLDLDVDLLCVLFVFTYKIKFAIKHALNIHRNMSIFLKIWVEYGRL
jgi:hypothetical protein